MGRGEISWNGLSPEGLKREVYAHRVGSEWEFFARQQRFDRWVTVDHPALEDWLALLDGVRRRAARRLVRPEEEHRLIKRIHELFPEAEL